MKSITPLLISSIFFVVSLLEINAQVMGVEGIDPQCYGNDDGIININVSPGTVVTAVFVNGPSPGTLASNNLQILDLLSGTYYLTISMDGLADYASSVEVTDPSELSFNISFTYDCANIKVVEICATNGGSNSNFGGIPPYSFYYLNNNNMIIDSFLNVMSLPCLDSTTTPNFLPVDLSTYTGDIELYVYDSNNCFTSQSQTFSHPVVSYSHEDVSCNGANDGSIDLIVSGGTEPYLYLWSNGATTEDIENLGPGLYSPTIQDANGCFAVDANIITQPISWNYLNTGTSHIILIPSNSVTVNGNPLVNGDLIGVFYDSLGTLACGGYITWQGTTTAIAAWGANTSLNNGFANQEEFTWLIFTQGYVIEAEAVYSSSTSFTGMGNWMLNGTSGIVSLTSEVIIGGSDSLIIEIVEPSQLFSGMTISDFNGYGVQCNGFSNGTIALNTVGGISPYSYVWDNGGSNSALYHLSPGNYSVTVSDSNNCQVTESVTMIEPDPVEISTIVTHNSCFGNNQGSIDLSIGGGVLPYEIYCSNGASTNNISGLEAGLYMIWVSDANNCTELFVTMIDQPDQIVVSVTTQNASNIGMADGIASLEVTGGTSPFSFFWSNGTTAALDSTLGLGTYFVTITDFTNCSISTNFEILEDTVFIYGCMDSTALNYNPLANISDGSCYSIDNPPAWEFVNTGVGHTIFLPLLSQIYFPPIIESGDYIGVFYDSSGTLACGGYTMWTKNASAITAWGDDLLTPGQDGFQNNETFQWKIWDASSGIAYFLSATYDSTYTNLDAFVVNGNSGIQSLATFIINTQTINLQQGWGCYSTYIDPYQPDIADVLSGIENHLIIVKDSYGNIYWPQYMVNLIGDMTIGRGYMIKMNSTQTTEVIGTMIIPEQSPIVLFPNWSILGYLRHSHAPIEIMLSSIVGNIEIVISGDGEIYWPQYYVNLIGIMYPGEGYRINMNAKDTLTYSPNSIPLTKSVK